MDRGICYLRIFSQLTGRYTFTNQLGRIRHLSLLMNYFKVLRRLLCNPLGLQMVHLALAFVRRHLDISIDCCSLGRWFAWTALKMPPWSSENTHPRSCSGQNTHNPGPLHRFCRDEHLQADTCKIISKLFEFLLFLTSLACMLYGKHISQSLRFLLRKNQSFLSGRDQKVPYQLFNRGFTSKPILHISVSTCVYICI